jgi:cytochrome bd-type quinol oxidase subunit 2
MINAKFVVSVVAMFVLSMAFGFVIHGVMLHGDYAKLPNLMRTEAAAQQLFGFMLLAHLLIAAGFSWIYIKGKESRPWLGQGLRYGVAVAVMMTIPMYLIYYVVMPYPSDVVAQQIAYDTMAIIVMGIVLAWINR